MTKLDHNRPALRLLDNYRRELRLQASHWEISQSGVQQSPRRNPMPPVTTGTQRLIGALFEAADDYFDAAEALFKNLNFGSRRTAHRTHSGIIEQLELAKRSLVDRCTALVLTAIKEAQQNKFEVYRWIEWLQKEAEDTKNDGLRLLLEIGFHPASARIDAMLSVK